MDDLVSRLHALTAPPSAPAAGVHREFPSCWRRPGQNIVQLNLAGSLGPGGAAGLGCIARNENDKFMAAAMMYPVEASSPLLVAL